MTVSLEQGGRYSPIRYEDGFFVGEDKHLLFKVTEDDDVTVPDDLDTWTFVWVLKQNIRQDEAVVEVDSDGITIVDDTDPDAPYETIEMVRVIVPRDSTIDLREGTYHHALARVDVNAWSVLAHGEAVLRYAAARFEEGGS